MEIKTEIKTGEIVHIYPTEVWFEKDFFGTVHIKMQHMAPDMKPFTLVTINYDYAYTSNSHQHKLTKEIGKLLGQSDIEERPWSMPESFEKDIEETTCFCFYCNKDRKTASGLPWTATRMILCPTCGNKRCPHATDHTLECTNSNDTGQPGSRY